MISTILKDCDTMVMAVDTPSIMYEDKELRTFSCCDIDDDILEFFQLTTIPEGEKKHVIFVPMKCEKWMHQGMINDVVDVVLKKNSTLISYLKKIPNVEVSIIPVETIGGVEFKEFCPSAILINKANETKDWCCLLTSDGKWVAKRDGSTVMIEEGEEICTDENELFIDAISGYYGKEYSVQRYKKTKNSDSVYSPKNCEQIVLHSMRFVFDELINNNRTPFIHFYLPYIPLIGNLTSKDMRSLLDRLKYYIKDGVEGIEKIHRTKSKRR